MISWHNALLSLHLLHCLGQFAPSVRARADLLCSALLLSKAPAWAFGTDDPRTSSVTPSYLALLILQSFEMGRVVPLDETCIWEVIRGTGGSSPQPPDSPLGCQFAYHCLCCSKEARADQINHAHGHHPEPVLRSISFR